MKKKIASLLIVMFTIVIIVVSAHKPIFESKDTTINSPIVIDNHQISYAMYGELEGKNDVDFYEFEAKEGQNFYIEMLVPKIKLNKDFEPNFVIISKQIKNKDIVPFDIPEGYGAINVPYPQNYTNEFFEKFTQTTYLRAQSISGTIEKDGTYIVGVYSTSKGGKYTLAIGKKEDFGFKDILTFPYIYLKIKYFFNPIITLLCIATVIFVFVGFYTLKKKRR